MYQQCGNNIALAIIVIIGIHFNKSPYFNPCLLMEVASPLGAESTVFPTLSRADLWAARQVSQERVGAAFSCAAPATQPSGTQGYVKANELVRPIAWRLG